MTPAVKLSMPFVIIAGCLLVTSHFAEDGFYGRIAIPFVIGAAICYILAPQINWRFYLKNPPKMDPGLHRLLETKVEFYQAMHPFERKKFRDRVMLFIEAVDFKAQVSDEFPSDMKICIACSAVRLLQGRGDYFFPKFENIILYPHPFPSPQFPENWHVSEIFEEDGVVLFAAKPLLLGFLTPKKYYDIALHEYAKVYRISYPNLDYPDLQENLWTELEKISGFSKEIITKSIGLPAIELWPVAVVHFFVYPKRFQSALPDLFRKMDAVFQTKLMD